MSKNLFRRKTNPKESVYQRKLLPKLRAIPNSKWFVKEAKSIRGIPDIIGCINGTYVELEVKKSEAEAQETSGRIVLQRKSIEDTRKVKGYAAFIYPENEKFVLEELSKL